MKQEKARNLIGALAMMIILTIGSTTGFGQKQLIEPNGSFISTRSGSAFGVCHKVKANEFSFFTGPTTVSGTVTQGGILNGTSEAVLTSAFLPTPDPNTLSFTTAKTFTTDKGVLQTHSPHMLDVVNGIGTAFAIIDGNASTGIFAGATGLLFINFKQDVDGASAQAEITGEVCFAR